MATTIENIALIVYLLVCCGLIFLTLVQNRKSEGIGAAITGQSDTSRGAMGREERLSHLIRQVSWGFLIGSLLVSLILRKLWS
ncbi:MAG: preprotein translocase subunit SecG [bacterium]|jgi:protein translocase SecG subunit